MPHKMPSAAELMHLRQASLAKGDPVPPPLVTAAMYHQPGTPDGTASYGRTDNATWQAVEHQLAHLEAAPALLFPSGMAAIAAPLFALLRAGDRILLPSDGYYTTRLLAGDMLARFGVTVETRPTAHFAEGGMAGFALVLVETPSNPGLDLCDLARIAAETRAEGGISVADNTTMTPFGQRPLDLGIDIVVASDTKAPSGQSDILLGHVATRDAGLMARMAEWRRLSGSIPGPHEAWLLLRSLDTLALRFGAMCAAAEIIAARLAERLGNVVAYPGLPSHPQHNLARSQMATPGFLIGLTMPDRESAEAFIDGCALLQPATSFGGTHSSAECRIRWGDDVAPGYVRLSIGCEPVEELWAAIDAAIR